MAKMIDLNYPTLTIGIRSPKKKTIYPLSFGQQLKVSKQITSMISELIAESEEMTDIRFGQKIFEKLIEIVPTIIVGCSDISEEEFENEVTNEQLIKIVEIIFEQNYSASLKNGKSLLEKIQKAFLSTNSQPTSSQNTPA